MIKVFDTEFKLEPKYLDLSLSSSIRVSKTRKLGNPGLGFVSSGYSSTKFLDFDSTNFCVCNNLGIFYDFK